jgi:hypothetical protein
MDDGERMLLTISNSKLNRRHTVTTTLPQRVTERMPHFPSGGRVANIVPEKAVTILVVIIHVPQTRRWFRSLLDKTPPLLPNVVDNLCYDF